VLSFTDFVSGQSTRSNSVFSVRLDRELPLGKLSARGRHESALIRARQLAKKTGWPTFAVLDLLGSSSQFLDSLSQWLIST
jgi:hypothetical protein